MSTFEERAKLRASWSVRVLEGHDVDEVPRPLTGDEAWNRVGELTQALWLARGGSLVFPPRAEWPVHVFRSGEPRDD